MEAVDVLFGGEGVDDLLFVDVARQRELDEDAVDARIPVEPVDDAEEFGFGDVAAISERLGVDAHFEGGFLLAAHVRGRGGVVAHEDDAEARRAMALRGPCGYGFTDLAAHLRRNGFAVDELCHGIREGWLG